MAERDEAPRGSGSPEGRMPQRQGHRDLLWARDLARLDDDRLRHNLESLPTTRQVDLVLSLGWGDRLRVIEASGHAAEIVKALPQEEVLLTIKAIGPEDALPILALTTPSQLRFILDVELWNREEVDDRKLLEWLHYMLACGESKILDFVATSDLELLTIVFTRLVHLVPNEEGMVIPEGLPSIMPDHFFTILSKFPAETESIGLFLRIVRQADKDLFYKLLFLAHGSLAEETQESALRWRNSRLEEVGLLDFEEAVEIYAYIGEDEARAMADAAPAPFYAPDEADAVAPGFPVLLVDRRTFFYDVLESLEEAALANRLRREIVFSANRLLVADAEHIGEIQSMKRALTRLFALTNIGLLFLAGADMERAIGVLRRLALRDIFQVGFSRVSDLRRRATGLAGRFWPDWKKQGFVFLDQDGREVMRGLMMRVPQYCDISGGLTVRDFETLDEVRAAASMLDEISAAAEACFLHLGLPEPRRARPELDAVFAQGIEDLTFRNILLTGAVKLLVRGEFSFTPLSRADLQGLFENALEKDAAGANVVTAAARDKVLQWAARATGFDGARLRALEHFLLAGLKQLEEEVGGLRTWQDADPRYLGSLIFSKHDAAGGGSL
jgi:hypothetical protein